MATTVSEDGERIIKLAMIGQTVCDAVQEAGLMVPRRKPGRKVHRQRAAPEPAPAPKPAPVKKERDRKGERERRKARERAKRQAMEQRNARQGLQPKAPPQPMRRVTEEPEETYDE